MHAIMYYSNTVVDITIGVLEQNTQIRRLHMRVTICIGSACHLKGSREVIQRLQNLVKQNGLEQKVDLNGSFCTGDCVNGVCVTVEEKLFSVTPDTVESFFNDEIIRRL